jgi:hypothetical protein
MRTYDFVVVFESMVIQYSASSICQTRVPHHMLSVIIARKYRVNFTGSVSWDLGQEVAGWVGHLHRCMKTLLTSQNFSHYYSVKNMIYLWDGWWWEVIFRTRMVLVGLGILYSPESHKTSCKYLLQGRESGCFFPSPRWTECSSGQYSWKYIGLSDPLSQMMKESFM